MTVHKGDGATVLAVIKDGAAEHFSVAEGLPRMVGQFALAGSTVTESADSACSYYSISTGTQTAHLRLYHS